MNMTDATLGTHDRYETFDQLHAAREARDRRTLALSLALKTRASPQPSNTAASHRRRNLSSIWRLRWCTGSITRPVAAGRSVRFSLPSSAKRPSLICRFTSVWPPNRMPRSRAMGTFRGLRGASNMLNGIAY